MNRFSHFRLRAVVLGALAVCGSACAGPHKSNGGLSAEPRLQAIEIVRRARGVFVHRYAENMADIDPRKDAESSRRVVDARVIHELKTLLTATEDYAPEYRVRCLPSWDTGLEFRESAEKRTTILFSFRCNQMMLFEERAYRDFTPQSVKFYALLNYELNDTTTNPVR